MVNSENIAERASYLTSGAVTIFGFTTGDIVSLVGVVCAIGTLATNVYFKSRHLKIAERKAASEYEKPDY